ncbi:hypothetical protein FOA52_001120 [Chlamydomonas sp. UWO 241]|nr:hypothetical protein FOA52_001120 [Chlamydomonas sp. UWO 241]
MGLPLLDYGSDPEEDSLVQIEHTGSKPLSSTNGAAGINGAQKPPPGQQRPVDAVQATQPEEDDNSDPLLTEDEVLEVRRSRAVLAAVMLLIERPSVSEGELSRLAAPMTGSELINAAEERALAGRCGNPTCDKEYRRGADHSATIMRQRLLHAYDNGNDDGDDDGDGNAGGSGRGGGRKRGGETPAATLAGCCCSGACTRAARVYARRLGDDPLSRLTPDARAIMLGDTPTLPSTARFAAAGGGGRGDAASASTPAAAAAAAVQPSHRPRQQQVAMPAPGVAARGRLGSVTMLSEVIEHASAPSSASASCGVAAPGGGGGDENGSRGGVPPSQAHRAVEGYVPRAGPASAPVQPTSSTVAVVGKSIGAGDAAGWAAAAAVTVHQSASSGAHHQDAAARGGSAPSTAAGASSSEGGGGTFSFAAVAAALPTPPEAAPSRTHECPPGSSSSSGSAANTGSTSNASPSTYMLPPHMRAWREPSPASPEPPQPEASAADARALAALMMVAALGDAPPFVQAPAPPLPPLPAPLPTPPPAPQLEPKVPVPAAANGAAAGAPATGTEHRSPPAQSSQHSTSEQPAKQQQPQPTDPRALWAKLRAAAAPRSILKASSSADTGVVNGGLAKVKRSGPRLTFSDQVDVAIVMSDDEVLSSMAARAIERANGGEGVQMRIGAFLGRHTSFRAPMRGSGDSGGIGFGSRTAPAPMRRQHVTVYPHFSAEPAPDSPSPGALAAAPAAAATTSTAGGAATPGKAATTGRLLQRPVAPRRQIIKLEHPLMPAGMRAVASAASAGGGNGDGGPSGSGGGGVGAAAGGGASKQQQALSTRGEATAAAAGTAAAPAPQQLSLTRELGPGGVVRIRGDVVPANAMQRERVREAIASAHSNAAVVGAVYGDGDNDDDDGSQYRGDSDEESDADGENGGGGGESSAGGGGTPPGEEPSDSDDDSEDDGESRGAGGAPRSSIGGGNGGSGRKAGAGQRRPPPLPPPPQAARPGQAPGTGPELPGAYAYSRPLSDTSLEAPDDDAGPASMPFLGPPPTGFRLELSSFNELWSVVGAWVSYATVDFLTGDEAQADGAVERAREETEREPAPARSARARAATELCTAVRDLVPALMLDAECSNGAASACGDACATFTLVESHVAAAKLSASQWRMLALALMRAAGRHRVPRLRAALDPPGSAPQGGDGASNNGDAGAGAGSAGAGSAGAEGSSARERLVGVLSQSGHLLHHLAALEDVLVARD